MFKKTYLVKLIFHPLIRTPTCAYQKVGNVSFNENFVQIDGDLLGTYKMNDPQNKYVNLAETCINDN